MAPMNGTIKRLVSDKGFGFILASDGNEYFFHNSACADTRFDEGKTSESRKSIRQSSPLGGPATRPEPRMPRFRSMR